MVKIKKIENLKKKEKKKICLTNIQAVAVAQGRTCGALGSILNTKNPKQTSNKTETFQIFKFHSYFELLGKCSKPVNKGLDLAKV